MITCEIHCCWRTEYARQLETDSDGRSGSRPAWILGVRPPGPLHVGPTEVAILLLKPGQP